MGKIKNVGPEYWLAEGDLFILVKECCSGSSNIEEATQKLLNKLSQKGLDTTPGGEPFDHDVCYEFINNNHELKNLIKG